MRNVWNDVRLALRGWRRSPGFTLVVVLTVALSVGATTALFSVLNGVLLRPLPYPDPERVIMLWSSNPGIGLPIFSVSPYDFLDWKEQAQSFEVIGARRVATYNLTGGGEPERISSERATADYFAALGLRPVLGRFFTPEEEAGGGARVVILNRNLWQRRFGADPGIVGSSILLDGESWQVIGVADDPLRGPVVELWTPLVLDLSKEVRGVHLVYPVGRLKKGVTLEAARAEMATIAARLARQYPEANEGWDVGMQRMHDFVVRDVRPRLLILFAAVLAVLLIACANLMNLFLVRFASRERELAIRVVLGAGRFRVAAQLLTEILVLAVAGGALGVVLAQGGTRGLLALNTQAVPRAGEIGVDARVLLFGLGASLLAGLAAGLLPALRASRPNLQAPIQEGARTLAGGVRGKLVRNTLVLTEVAAALVLLVAAGLLIKSFWRLNDVDPGFRASGGLTARVYLPPAQYREPERQIAAWRSVLEGLRALPGVAEAGLIGRMPLLEERVLKGGAYLKEAPPATTNEMPLINFRAVSPGTFRALGIPLRAGRAPLESDGTTTAPVVVINEALARRLWPAGDGVGRQIVYEVGPSGPLEATVVGIAANLRNKSLDTEGDLEVYAPFTQAPLPAMSLAEATLVVRTSGDPAALAGPMRRVVSGVDPDLPLSQVRTLEDIVSQALSPARFGMMLLALFAGLALILASVGVYGVLAYSVAGRTQEIGVRMAVGADRGDVLWMILRQSLTLATAGVLLGLAGAAGLTRLLAGQLFGVSPRDPVIFAGVAALLTLVALVAGWVPARRATGVDPLLAMR